MPRRLLALAALLLLPGARLHAQSGEARQAACYEQTAIDTGRWRPTIQPDFGQTAAGRERQAARTLVPALRRALALFQELPALKPPVGGDVESQMEVLGPTAEQGPEGERGTGVIGGWVAVNFGQQLCNERGPIAFSNGTKRLVGRIGVELRINRVPVRETLGRDAAGAMFTQPSDSGILIVTRRPGPIYVPVTRERWLRFKLAEAKAAAAQRGSAVSLVDRDSIEWAEGNRRDSAGLAQAFQELAKTNPTAAKEARDAYRLGQIEGAKQWALKRRMEQQRAGDTGGAVAEIEGELAALSEEERRAPAMLLRGIRDGRIVASGLARDGEPSEALVSVNPALFDRNRPTAVQLVTYRVSGAAEQKYPSHRRIAHALREQITREVLARLLDAP